MLSPTPPALVLIGVSASVTSCQLCGKRGLRKTVVLLTPEGETVYYGSDCAALSQTFGRKPARVAYWVRVMQLISVLNTPAHTFAQLRARVWHEQGQQVEQYGDMLSVYDSDQRRNIIEVASQVQAGPIC